MSNFGIGFGGGFGLGLVVGNPLQYPNINGFSPSWASIEFKFAGSPIVTVQSIDYAPSNDSKEVYGTNPNPLSVTRGKIANKAKAKMLLAEADTLLGALAAQDFTGNNAYGDIFFDVNVTYTESGFNQISDTLRGCRVYGVEQSSSEGPDAIMVTLDLRPLVILRNGRPMSSALLSAPQFP